MSADKSQPFEEALMSLKRDISQLATDIDRPLCRAHRVLLQSRLKSVRPVSTTQELSNYVPQNWQQGLINELRVFEQLTGLRGCRQALRQEKQRRRPKVASRTARHNVADNKPQLTESEQLEVDMMHDILSRLEGRLTLSHAASIKAAIGGQHTPNHPNNNMS